MRPRRAWLTRWYASHSCQPSPSATGWSWMTQEPASRSLVLLVEQTSQVLGIPPGQLQRRPLGAPTVATPGVVVAPQHPAVVLELHQVQLVAAEYEQVDLMPPLAISLVLLAPVG